MMSSAVTEGRVSSSAKAMSDDTDRIVRATNSDNNAVSLKEDVL